MNQNTTHQPSVEELIGELQENLAATDAKISQVNTSAKNAIAEAGSAVEALAETIDRTTRELDQIETDAAEELDILMMQYAEDLETEV